MTRNKAVVINMLLCAVLEIKFQESVEIKLIEKLENCRMGIGYTKHQHYVYKCRITPEVQMPFLVAFRPV